MPKITSPAVVATGINLKRVTFALDEDATLRVVCTYDLLDAAGRVLSVNHAGRPCPPALAPVITAYLASLPASIAAEEGI